MRNVLTAIAVVAVLSVTYFAIWLITGQVVPCMFRLLTGLHCAGCGNSRMILSIVQLDFYQAFRYNPAVFLMLPIFAGIFIRHLIFYIQGKQVPVSKLEKVILIVLLVLLVLFGIARNLPFFSYLAPTSV